MKIGLVQDVGRTMGNAAPVCPQRRIAEMVDEAVFAEET